MTRYRLSSSVPGANRPWLIESDEDNQPLHPDVVDFIRKVRYAREVQGFRFLLMLSPCPTGWKSEPEESVELIRKAVGSGLFPLYEVFDGVRYRINVHPDGTPLSEYAESQRRYTQSSVNVVMLEEHVRRQWIYLETMSKNFPTP